MKTLSIAALLAGSLATVGLAGCQTVEDPGYGYYESDDGAYEVPTATYRSDVYVGGGYVSGGWGERRPPRVAWDRDRPPPPRYSPPPRWEHAPPPRYEPRPPPRFEPPPPPPPQYQPPAPHQPGPPPPRGGHHGPRPPWLLPER